MSHPPILPCRREGGALLLEGSRLERTDGRLTDTVFLAAQLRNLSDQLIHKFCVLADACDISQRTTRLLDRL